MGIDLSGLDPKHPLFKKIQAADIQATPARKSRRDDPEHRLQVSCVNLFRTIYPKLTHRMFAIPSGGDRNIVVASKMKAGGVIAGVWDLFLAVPSGDYGGCWIETKQPGTGLSVAQREFRAQLKNDYDFFVYRNQHEFLTGIKNFMNQKSNIDLYE